MNNKNNCWTDKLLNNAMFSDDENNYNIIDSADQVYPADQPDQKILIEENPHHTPKKENPNNLTLDPDVSPWSPMRAFEEGTPMENYFDYQQQDPFVNNNDGENDEGNDEENEEVQPDMKYKSCMDEWSKKEKERYVNTPKCRKILFNDDDFRIDPYDYQFYTRGEFYEYYGSNEIWNQQEPKKCLLRDHLHQIMDNYSHLDSKVLSVFMKSIANTYS